MNTDPRVAAIRADKAVGKGSCASIDECWGDAELVKALDDDKVKGPKAAVRWARKTERLYLNRALDAREGGDNDPQLQWKARFKRVCAENPV